MSATGKGGIGRVFTPAEGEPRLAELMLKTPVGGTILVQAPTLTSRRQALRWLRKRGKKYAQQWSIEQFLHYTRTVDRLDLGSEVVETVHQIPRYEALCIKTGEARLFNTQWTEAKRQERLAQLEEER